MSSSVDAIPVRVRLLHPNRLDSHYLSVETYHQIPLQDYDALWDGLQRHLLKEVPRFIEEKGYVSYGDKISATLRVEVSIDECKGEREFFYSTFSKISEELSLIKTKTLESIVEERSIRSKTDSSSPPLTVEMKMKWKIGNQEHIPTLRYYCYPPGDAQKTINKIMVRISMLM
jgi:hypothetical protein